ncbi:hypothetical protein SUGI_0356680 [Cryptomeria japonica]|nr:hypothetical protein SUGI_0356680 [Cryptomeria japonica]
MLKARLNRSSMASNNVIAMVVVSLTFCCFCSLLCAEEVHGGPHLERNSSIGRLKRMEASIKAVQTHVGDSSTYERVPCSSSFCSALGNSTCAPDCRYSHLYSQSWITRGDLSFETFNVGNHSFGGVAFGCSNETYGDGLVIADGVLGLGRGKLSLI